MKKIKKFFKEYWVLIVFFIFNLVFFYLPIPYTVSGIGGLIPIEDRFSIDDKNISNYYMAYVTSLKGTPATVLYGLLNKNYEVEKMSLKEIDDDNLYSQVLLDTSSNSSVINAYKKAGKEISIDKAFFEVLGFENNSNNLKVMDKIIGIEGKKFKTEEEVYSAFNSILSEKEVGDKVNLTVERDNKKIDAWATIVLIDDEKKLGLSGFVSSDINVSPSIKFNFDKHESGPSGGFMMSLAIYDLLVEDDIAHGLKIAGTGTIDADGNVGVIGGVSHKIRGAKKEDIDIFFVPDENYEDANKICKSEGCDFDLVKINTFDEALEYLKNYN